MNSIFLAQGSYNIDQYNFVKRIDLRSTSWIIQIKEKQWSAGKLSGHERINSECVFDSFATSIVLHIAYGHEILSEDDPYVQITADSSYAITHCGPPGGTPVDLFPICRLPFARG